MARIHRELLELKLAFQPLWLKWLLALGFVLWLQNWVKKVREKIMRFTV